MALLALATYMATFVNKCSLSNLTLIQKVTFVDEAGAAQAMAELEDGSPFTFSFECDHFSIFREKLSKCNSEKLISGR